jgi:hypothetical protein
MTKRSGSCVCSEIAYRINSDIKNIVNCHCSFCRSHSGAAFSSYATLPYVSLEITRGEESMSTYEVEGGKKYFCSQCGTPIFNLNEKYPGACMIYLGTLDDTSDITPKMNIWYENRLAWVDEIPNINSMSKGIETR